MTIYFLTHPWLFSYIICFPLQLFSVCNIVQLVVKICNGCFQAIFRVINNTWFKLRIPNKKTCQMFLDFCHHGLFHGCWIVDLWIFQNLVRKSNFNDHWNFANKKINIAKCYSVPTKKHQEQRWSRDLFWIQVRFRVNV